MDKVCKEFDVDFDFFTERKKMKQVNKDAAVGYLAETQNFAMPEGILEKIMFRLEKLELTISDINNKN